MNITRASLLLLLTSASLISAAPQGGRRVSEHDDPPSSSLAVRIVIAGGGKLSGRVLVRLACESTPAAAAVTAARVAEVGECQNTGRREAFCDPRGNAAFNDIDPGNYSLSVSLTGFVPYSEHLRIERHEDRQLVVELRRADVAAACQPRLQVPEKAQQKFDKGCALFEGKDYQGAIKQFRDAVKIQPDFAPAYLQLGLAYRRLGSLEEAARSFENATRDDPKSLPAWLNLAEVFAQRKDFQRARTTLQEAAKIAPQRAEPYYLLARIQFETGNLQRAELACTEALARDYSHVPELHILLADIHLKNKQPAKAEAELKAYLAAAPEGAHAIHAAAGLKQIQQEQAK